MILYKNVYLSQFIHVFIPQVNDFLILSDEPIFRTILWLIYKQKCKILYQI